jgi:hypothetical protein
MKKFCKTSIFATGSINEVKEFENSLPITDLLFDFGKIISPTEEFHKIYNNISSDQHLRICDWRNKNWGTPSNGTVYKTSRIYFEPEMAYEFQIVNAYEPPTLVLNEIIKNHRNLFYLMHYIDYLDNEFIAYRTVDNTEFKVVCDSYCYINEDCEKSGCNISLENLCKLENFKITQPQRDFIMSFNIGKFIIKNI